MDGGSAGVNKPLALCAGRGVGVRVVRRAAVIIRKPYDAHYLALSQLLGREFWTADQRLLRQVQGALPFVRWLGDFVPSGGA